MPIGRERSVRSNLGRAGLVLEINAELIDELAGQVGVRDLVDGARYFLGVPGHADLVRGRLGIEYRHADRSRSVRCTRTEGHIGDGHADGLVGDQ
jgi:hypothetical protein